MASRRATEHGGKPSGSNSNPYIRLDLREIIKMDQPTIDLNLGNLERVQKRTSGFKAAVMKYVQVNREEVLKRRVGHAQDVGMLRAEKQATERELVEWRTKEIALAKRLEEEKQERKNAEDSLANHNRQVKAQKERIEEKDEESTRLEAQLAALVKNKERDKRLLEKQASTVGADVLEIERRLGATIGGIANDALLIQFTSLDTKDLEREFKVFLDLSQHEYKVTDTSPTLGLAVLAALVEQLNETRDMYGFLRRIRQAFEDLVEQGG